MSRYASWMPVVTLALGCGAGEGLPPDAAAGLDAPASADAAGSATDALVSLADAGVPAPDAAPPDAAPMMAPDFQLLDVSSASPRSGELVSPRDYQGQISAWYFAHAT